MTTILHGNIVSAPALGTLEIAEQGYLIAEGGVITGVFPAFRRRMPARLWRNGGTA